MRDLIAGGLPPIRPLGPAPRAPRFVLLGCPSEPVGAHDRGAGADGPREEQGANGRPTRTARALDGLGSLFAFLDWRAAHELSNAVVCIFNSVWNCKRFIIAASYFKWKDF